MSRASRFGPSRLLALEPLLVLGVLTLCIAACVREIPVIRHKLGLVEPLLGASVARIETAERFALRGRLDDGAIGPAAPPVESSRGARWYLQAGGGIVIEGIGTGADARPFRLSLNPAVPGDGTDAQLIWLCGRRRAPAGWSSPAPAVVDGLAVAQLPALCRGAA